jgi:hypothetical protein
MKRRLLALGLVLAVGACDTTQSPSSSLDDLAPRSALVQGDQGLGGEAYFKPPIGSASGIPAGLNPNLLVRLVICENSPAEVCAETDAAKVIPSSEITVDLVDEWYLANWDTDDRTKTGPAFRIFAVLPLVGAVAYADVELGSSGSDLKAIRDGVEEVVALKEGRTLPIGVRLLGFNEQPSSRASDCVDGITGSGILDCAVVTVPEGGPSPAPLVVTETSTGGEDVGQLTPPPTSSKAYDPACVATSGFVSACLEAFTLVFEHINFNPGQNASPPIPDADAYGFFVRVDAFDAAGDPVIFDPADGGWELLLCQDAAAEALGGPLVRALAVFQAKDDGTLTFPAFTNGTGGFCTGAGNGSALIRPDNGSVLGQIRTKLRSLATLVAPRALFASAGTVTHGGKRTTGLTDFSGFGTTLTNLTAAPTGWGSPFGYSGPNGDTGIGLGPFSTNGGAGCPVFSQSPTLADGTPTADGSGIWPLGGILVLTKRFTTTASSVKLQLAIDNDFGIKLEGVEIPVVFGPGGNVLSDDGQFSPGPTLGSPYDVTLTNHENCAARPNIEIQLDLPTASDGIYDLEIIARDRGTIGYVDANIVEL